MFEFVDKFFIVLKLQFINFVNQAFNVSHS